MSTRSGLRPKRATATASATDTATPTKKPKKIFNKVNEESSKINSSSPPDVTHTIESFLGTTDSTKKPLYPSLELHKAEASSKNLYPSLENITPVKQRRRRISAATTSKKAVTKRVINGRKQQGMVTPTKNEPAEKFVPQTSVFDFKFSAGLEEAGKKILEELKVSSAALQARMKEEARLKAENALPELVPESGSEGTGTAAGQAPTKRRRFSDEHKKQFNKMTSIADHYVAKRAKIQKPTADNTGVASKADPKTPKNLKRKSVSDEKDQSEETPSKTTSTNTELEEPEIADDSPIPASKRTKLDGTPYAVSKTPRPASIPGAPATPFLPGALHGISRAASLKQSSLPRIVKKDGHPSTPAKPVAVATPIKEVTLLASPSKLRPPGTIMKPSHTPAAPGTPSPVKCNVPITVENFTFRSMGPAPKFPELKKLQKEGAPKPSVRWADATDESGKEEEPRSLFDSVVIEVGGGQKRKERSSSTEGGEPSTAATPARKRARLMPELGQPKIAQQPQTSPVKRPPHTVKQLRHSRLEFLATPKRRAIVAAKSVKPSKPRWKI